MEQPKRPGDFSVGSIVRKLYCCTLNARVSKLETELEQQGSKHVEGDLIDIRIFKLTAERVRKEGKELLDAILDVAKVFNSVDNKRILEILGKRGDPNTFLEVIASVYQGNERR